MKKLILACCAFLIFAEMAIAQMVTPPGFIPAVPFANLPTGIGLGTSRWVTNTDGTGCNNLGAIWRLCVYDGAAWIIGEASEASGVFTSVVGTANQITSSAPTGPDTTLSIPVDLRLPGGLAGAVVSPAQITANQDDYAGCNNSLVCRIDLDADRTITSLAAPVAGRSLIVWNISAFVLTLDDAAATGTAANRILSTDGADLPIGQNQGAFVVYDGTTLRWRVFGLRTYLTTETQGLQNVFDINNIINTADENRPVTIGTTGAGNAYLIQRHSTRNLEIICNTSPTPNDCDYIKRLQNGRYGGWSNENGETTFRWDAQNKILKHLATVYKTIPVYHASEALAVNNGAFYYVVPPELSGMNLVSVSGQVITVSSSGLPTVALTRCAVVATNNMCSGATVAMLSTNLTWDANENRTSTAATPVGINAANDDVATDQVVRVDITVAGTGTQGMILTLGFALPAI
jgi:hypothetical protein